MVNVKFHTSNSAEGTIRVKFEPTAEIEPMAQSQNTVQKPSDTQSRKRRRQPAVQYADIYSDDSESEPPVKQERLAAGQGGQNSKSANWVRKPHTSLYTDTCSRYKSDTRSLAHPNRVSQDELPELYRKSTELCTFINGRYEQIHLDLLRIKKIKAVYIVKVAVQKKEVAEAKSACQTAEIQAAVFKKSYEDSNLQLTLKVAGPVSQAQIKLEDVKENSMVEIAELRAQLAQKDADEKAAQEARITAEMGLAELRAATISEAPEHTQEISDLHLELANFRRLSEVAETSAQEAMTTNAQLRAEIQESEAKIFHLEQEVNTIRAEFVAQKKSLLKANGKLTADKQELEQRVIRQKSAIDCLTNDL